MLSNALWRQCLHIVNSGRLSLCKYFFVFFAGLSFFTRTVLILKIWSVLTVGQILQVFCIGLFYDLTTALYFSAPLFFYLIVLPDRLFNSRWNRGFIVALSFVVVSLLLFTAVSEYVFFDEFGTRFNFIAVDYLVYTTEVLRNIQESYPILPVMIGVAVMACTIVVACRRKLYYLTTKPTLLRQRLLAVVFYSLLFFVSMMTIDQSLASKSSNPYANELASNGIYNLFAALKNNAINYRSFYATIDDTKALLLLRKELQENGGEFFAANPADIRRSIVSAKPEKKLNIVVVMVESLSAEFLGVFGNKSNLTPNLDRLTQQSLFFRNAYATGTRSDRGLEAVTLSVPPTPGRSLIKRPDNENLFSWGRLMQSKGYDVKFIYGGYGYFDNMNYFFGNNGYTAIDRLNINREDIHFENAWGVCDEDLFDKTLVELNKSYKSGKPFFVHIMTTSNHRPFTYPEGRINIPSKSGRNGAVKYTDYAIGRFLETSKKEPWFVDTIFVIVADHTASSAGKTDLPLERYHIPLLIYAPAHITPGVRDAMISQIDIAPTVLGILNFSYVSKFFGRDVLKMGNNSAEALIGTYQKLGYIKNGVQIILDVKKQIAIHRLHKQNIVLDSPEERMITEQAISHYQSASYMLEKRLNNWE